MSSSWAAEESRKLAQVKPSQAKLSVLPLKAKLAADHIRPKLAAEHIRPLPDEHALVTGQSNLPSPARPPTRAELEARALLAVSHPGQASSRSTESASVATKAMKSGASAIARSASLQQVKSAASAMASAATRLGLADSQTKNLVKLAAASAAKQVEADQKPLSSFVEAQINEIVSKAVAHVEAEAVAKAKEEADQQSKVLQSMIAQAARDTAKALKDSPAATAVSVSTGKPAKGAAATDCSKVNVTDKNLRAAGKVSCDVTFDSATFECATNFEVECPASCPVEPVNGDNWFSSNSSVCTAARLVGAIDAHGGKFTVASIAPQKQFPANFANFVHSVALNSSLPLQAYTVVFPPCNVSDAASCHKDAKCELTLGLYMCRCRPGYLGDGQDCKEIEECTVGKDNCNSDASCVEFPGGHRCICPAGYEGNGLKGTDCHPICSGLWGPAACGGPLKGKCQKPGLCSCQPHFAGPECASSEPAPTCAAAGVKAGDMTLYLGGDTSKPFMATCKLGVDGAIETYVSSFKLVASNDSYLLVSKHGYNSVYGCEGSFIDSATQAISFDTPFKVLSLPHSSAPAPPL